MTANSVAPAFTGQFRELPEAECLELLKTKQLGRVAYHDDGPVVLGVKYAIDEGTVLFRTSPHSSVAQHMRGTHAAFQVDEIDDETDAGWSVLIRGTTTYVDAATCPRSPTDDLLGMSPALMCLGTKRRHQLDFDAPQ